MKWIEKIKLNRETNKLIKVISKEYRKYIEDIVFGTKQESTEFKGLAQYIKENEVKG